jgi:hypothetical protein
MVIKIRIIIKKVHGMHVFHVRKSESNIISQKLNNTMLNLYTTIKISLITIII